MLFNCPKCGFSQPKDQYCASCGCNMLTFKAKSSPWKKLAGDPIVQISTVFVLVFFSILFIRNQQRAELLARVQYLKGGPVMVGKPTGESRLAADSVAGEAAMVGQDSASKAEASLNPPTNIANNSYSAKIPRPAGLAGAAQVANATGANANSGHAGKIVINYLEMDRALLKTWLDEMQRKGTLKVFEEASMGVISDVLAKTKVAKGIKVLQSVEQSPETTGSAEWFVGTHRGDDPENEIGFFSTLAITEVKDGMIHGEVEIQRAFIREKIMDRVSVGSPFDIPPGAGFLFTGILPRRSVSELGKDDKADPALSSIFKSTDFQAGRTEFTVLIEFDPAPTN